MRLVGGGLWEPNGRHREACRRRVRDGEIDRRRLPRRERPSQRVLALRDRKSTRLNSSHGYISYAVFCLKKKNYTSSPAFPAQKGCVGTPTGQSPTTYGD